MRSRESGKNTHVSYIVLGGRSNLLHYMVDVRRSRVALGPLYRTVWRLCLLSMNICSRYILEKQRSTDKNHECKIDEKIL